MLRIIFSFLFVVACSFSHAQNVSTLCGLAGNSGLTNGTGGAARFMDPSSICVDKLGNLYVADRLNHCIRKITSSGVVSTLAGNGSAGSSDGSGSNASFNEPSSLAIDTNGNLYVADTKNYKIRKINISSALVTTIAGTGVFGTTNGPTNISRFGFSTGIAVTKDGAIIYVADYNTHVIRKIENNIVSNFAGTVFIAGSNNGSGVSASFNHPHSLALDGNGNLVVSDAWNNILRKITSSGIVSTFAGTGMVGGVDGNTSVCTFNYPWGIVYDDMNNLFVLDGYNFTIRKVLANNTVSTYCGTYMVSGSADGNSTSSSFNNAEGITFDPISKAIFVADTKNNTIRKIVNVSSIVLNISSASGNTICNGSNVSLSITPTNLSSYVVSDNGNVIATSNTPNVILSGLSTGTHTITCTAIDGNGAVASSNTLSLNVLAPFNASITSSSTIICPSSTVTLNASAGSSYLWSNNSTSQNISISTAGSFYCIVTNSAGCKDTTNSIAVTASSIQQATIFSADTVICPYDSTAITASSGSSWLWSNGSTTQNISVPAGNFSCTVTHIDGCTSISSNLTISNYIVNPPTTTPSGFLTITNGDSILISANGNGTFVWSNGIGGNSIYVSAPGVYSITQTDLNGCTSNSAPITVQIINSNSIISASGSTSFCDGQQVVLTSIFPAGNQWFLNGLPISNETNQSITITDAGYYHVGNWQNNNWVYSDSIQVIVFPSAQFPSIADTSICKGGSVVLSAPLSNDSYVWYDQQISGNIIGTGNTFSSPIILSPTTYYVLATNQYGCSSIDRLDVTVSLLPGPQIDFSTTTQSSVGQFTTTFNNQTINADVYYWIFGDTTLPNNYSTLEHPTHIFNQTGDYPIQLIAINTINGCTDTLYRTITINGNNKLFIPTTFTPNADGKNDVFRVRGNKFTISTFNIIDQWGNLIYSNNSNLPSWDGTSNGTIVPNGTYGYQINVVYDDSRQELLTGSISVIR